MTLLETAPAMPAVDLPTPAPKAGFPIRRVISTTLLILSASLLGFTLYIGLVSTLHYDRAQHDAYADFRVALAKATAPTGPTDPDNPTALLAPGSAVAVLDIPEIGLRAVVFEGTTGGILENGPGHLRDTRLPGQAGIAEIMGRAATYGAPFGRISELNPGDQFTVITGQGTAHYRVADIRRAGDREPPPLAAGHGRLTLATADGFAFLPTGVLRVDANLTSPAQPAPPMVLSSANLSPAEQALAGDPTAWVPLVLWGQGLLVAAALITWARSRWSRWQVWIVAVPVLGFLGLSAADQVGRLLLNLM
ncbi:MAG TPA: sortase [Pseudonocardiaceae bacterium]